MYVIAAASDLQVPEIRLVQMALLKNFNLQHLEGGHGTRPLPSRDTVNTWSALMTKLVIEEGYAAQKCRDTSAVIKTLEETLRPMEERGKELTRIQQYMDQLNLRLSQIKVDEATVYRKATLEKSTLGALRTQIAAAKALDVFWTRHQEAAACLQLLCASLADAQNAQTKALAARADWSAVQDHLLDSDIVEAYFSIKITRMKPFDLAGKSIRFSLISLTWTGRLGSLSRAPTRPELTKPPCVPKYFGNPEDLHGMGNYGLAFDFAPGHLLLAIGEKPNYKRYAVNSQAWAQEHFSHLKEPKVHYASILADGNVIVGSQEFSEHFDKWEQCRELLSAKWEAGMSSSNLVSSSSDCALKVILTDAVEEPLCLGASTLRSADQALGRLRRRLQGASNPIETRDPQEGAHGPPRQRPVNAPQCPHP
jgi:hypothetical protein